MRRLLATSGSTGTPKIIVGTAPAVWEPPAGAAAAVSGDSDDDVTLCASPLYHNNGFGYCYPQLLAAKRVVLLEHFDAQVAVAAIEGHQVTMTVLVPTMLQRIARLEKVEAVNLRSLRRVIYGGASLPRWVARRWLDLVDPERFYFVYGGSELIGATMCNGSEWLLRPGTVGRPIDCSIAILDPTQNRLPARNVGEIWLKLHSGVQPFRYLGSETPEPILGGYRTFGDMGWLDEDGYLYIADRRQDMIVTGGVNVFPAEVEAALSEHPQVADVVVVGLLDREWGRRVHAIVEPVEFVDAPSPEALRSFCKDRLSGPKVPKEFEIIQKIPRSAAGKLNRSLLAAERSAEPRTAQEL
jgi:bile acid-coenzyme A ligase